MVLSRFLKSCKKSDRFSSFLQWDFYFQTGSRAKQVATKPPSRLKKVKDIRPKMMVQFFHIFIPKVNKTKCLICKSLFSPPFSHMRKSYQQKRFSLFLYQLKSQKPFKNSRKFFGHTIGWTHAKQLKRPRDQQDLIFKDLILQPTGPSINMSSKKFGTRKKKVPPVKRSCS